MNRKIQAPVQHLVLTGKGVTPQIPEPYTLKAGDVGFDINTHIMVGQWALNVDDNYWYYRGRSKIYRLQVKTDDITSGQSSNVTVYDPTISYLAGNTYVSYSSVTPAFQQEAIYRCVSNTNAGESPETHPSKWEKQGDDFVETIIEISDVNGLSSELEYLKKYLPRTYSVELVQLTTTITIPTQEDINYYIRVDSYIVGSDEAADMIFIDDKTINSFRVTSDIDYEIGTLIYTVIKLQS